MHRDRRKGGRPLDGDGSLQEEPGRPERQVGVGQLGRLLKGYRGALLGCTAATLVASGLGLAQPLLVKRVIEGADAPSVPWSTIAGLVALFVAQALVLGVVHYVLARTSERVVLGIPINLIDQLLRLHMPVYERHRTGDLISRTSADSTALRRVVAEGVTDAITGTIGVVGAVAVMIWLDAVLFVLVVVLVGVGSVVVSLAPRGMRAPSLRNQQAAGEMAADLERALAPSAPCAPAALSNARASASPPEPERPTGRASGWRAWTP